MPLSPATLAILAKQLADVSGAFAKGNPVQEAMAKIVSDRTGGLVSATQFNKSQAELERKLLNVINKAEDVPQSGVAFGLPERFNGSTRSALTIPGTPEQPSPSLTPSQFPESRTLEEAGIATPGRVNPLQALGMGQQATQSAIAQEQQNSFQVEKLLKVEIAWDKFLKVQEMRRKRDERMLELGMSIRLEEDVLSGKREARDVSTIGGKLTNIGRTQDLLERPSPEQVGRRETATLSQQESAATIAESDAEFAERMNQAKLRTAEGAQRTPAKIASAQRQAVFQIIGGIRRAMEADQEASGEDKSDEMKSLEAGLRIYINTGAGFDSPKFQDLLASVPKKYIKGIQDQMVALSEGILRGENPNLIVPLATQPRSIKDIDMADFIIDDEISELDRKLQVRDWRDFL